MSIKKGNSFNPKNALLQYKIVNAFAGDAEGESIKSLVSKITPGYVICPNDKWKAYVENHLGNKLMKKTRTVFSTKRLDIEHLNKLKAKIPTGYKVAKLNNELIDSFYDMLTQQYSYYYDTIERFKKDGFGFCALKGDEIVAVAATHIPHYKQAFEVQIDTHPDHRRKGLATLVGAHLVAYSIENGYTPVWDTFNKESAALALKLGYTEPREYEFLRMSDE